MTGARPGLAAGAGAALTHDEVTATAERVRPVFAKLIDAIAGRIAGA